MNFGKSNSQVIVSRRLEENFWVGALHKQQPQPRIHTLLTTPFTRTETLIFVRLRKVRKTSQMLFGRFLPGGKELDNFSRIKYLVFKAEFLLVKSS